MPVTVPKSTGAGSEPTSEKQNTITLEISYREDPKKRKMEVELEIKEHFSSARRAAGRATVGPAR